jgi:Cu/Ag efflux pump CusA
VRHRCVLVFLPFDFDSKWNVSRTQEWSTVELRTPELLLMWWLGFNLSVAVMVGFIALAGVAETGVVMLIYLDSALSKLRTEREAAGRPFTRGDLHAAIMKGAVERVRPHRVGEG